MDDGPPEQGFAQACARVNDANTHMLDGDWSVWQELLSAGDDFAAFRPSVGLALEA